MDKVNEAKLPLSGIPNVSDLTDQLDLNRDEFLRIKAFCGNHPDNVFFQEIAGLCERSQTVIKQRVSVIQQRDTAQALITSLEKDKADALARVAELEGQIEAERCLETCKSCNQQWSPSIVEYGICVFCHIKSLTTERDTWKRRYDEKEKPVLVLGQELATLRNQLTHIYAAVEGYIDGAPDAGETAALANEVAHIIEHPERLPVKEGGATWPKTPFTRFDSQGNYQP